MVYGTSMDDVFHTLGNLQWRVSNNPTLPIRKVTRLEAHRRSLEKEERHGPLLRIEDLNPDEISIINSSFLDLCRKRKISDLHETYQAYVDTLHTWGVMCPHPQPHRLYDGRHCDHPLSFDDSRWFDCTLCGAAVVNR